MAYNFNQFSNYGGAYGSGIAGSYSSPLNGGYGQSVSSEAVDYNNLQQMPQYAQAAYSPCANPCSNPCAAPAPQQYCQQNQLDTNDPQLQQQVDQIVQSLQQYKRPVLRRQVITVPSSCPGRVACLTRRLPTPAPDIIERITVVKPPRDVVNLTIEKPTQPGPCFQQREICGKLLLVTIIITRIFEIIIIFKGKSRKPLIQPRVVTVPPRSSGCQQSAQQPCTPPPPPPQPACVPCAPPPAAACTPAPYSSPYMPYSSPQFASPFPQFSTPPPVGASQSPQFSPYSTPNYSSFPPSNTPFAGMSSYPNFQQSQYSTGY